MRKLLMTALLALPVSVNATQLLCKAQGYSSSIGIDLEQAKLDYYGTMYDLKKTDETMAFLIFEADMEARAPNVVNVRLKINRDTLLTTIAYRSAEKRVLDTQYAKYRLLEPKI